MRKFLAFLCVLSGFLCCRVTAQPYIDLLNAKYYALPEQTNFSGENKKVNVSWVTASSELPLKIKDDYLVVNPSFEMYKFDPSPILSNNLYGIALPLTYLKQWKNSSWQTAFGVIPRISSDKINLSSDDYQLGGIVLAIYKKNENLKYKFGAYYNSEYFGPFLLPLLGLDWKINDRFSLFGVLPASMNLEYKAGKNIYTGIAIYTLINSYRLSNGDWFKVDDNHFKLFVDYNVTKNTVFSIEAGYSLFRKYTYGTVNFNSDIRTNLQFEDGCIFKVGFAYRLRLDEMKSRQE